MQEFIEDELRGETKPMAYYLHLEKEQIEKSFNEGWLQCNIHELPEKSRKHFKTANEYFDFTYTQSGGFKTLMQQGQ